MMSAPGYFYALSYALAAIAFSVYLPAKGELWQRVLTWILLALAGFLVCYMFDLGEIVFFLPTLFFAILFAMLILLFTCDLSLFTVLYYSCHAFIVGEFCTALAWQVNLFLDQKVLAILVGLAAIVEAGVYSSRHKEISVDGKVLLSTFLTALGIYLFSNLSNVYQDTPFSGQTASQINLIRMLIDAGGMILLEASRAQREEASLMAEVEIMRSLMQMQYENYQATDRSLALVQQKYHDLKHQIAYLRDATPRNKQVCLDQMEQEIQGFEASCNTGNHVVDIVLMDKMLKGQEKGIRFTFVVDGHLLDFMAPMDISALLGNLLDNAIEEAEGLEDVEKRWIEISLRQKNEFVVLNVGNHYKGELQFEKGIPISTKEDHRFHGFGTKSIQAIACKYNGSVSFQAEGDWFLAKVCFAR